MIYSCASFEVCRITTKDSPTIFLDSDGSAVALTPEAIMLVEPVGQTIDTKLPAVAIPGLVARKISEILPRSTDIPKESRIILREDMPDGAIKFSSVDRAKAQSVLCENASVQSIPWRAAAKRLRSLCASRVCLDTDVLIRLLDAMKRASGKCPAFFEVGAKHIVIRMVNGLTHQSVVGIVPTMDTKGTWLEDTEWERLLFTRSAAIKRQPE